MSKFIEVNIMLRNGHLVPAIVNVDTINVVENHNNNAFILIGDNSFTVDESYQEIVKKILGV